MLSWAKVQRPYVYDGLGVHDLERMSWVYASSSGHPLQADPSKPWAGLPIHIPKQAHALFKMAVLVKHWEWGSYKVLD